MTGVTQELGKIQSGDHVVFIYENPRELLAFAVPFIKDGLAKGERCLYVVDDLKRSDVVEALSAGGVDVNGEIERGALLVLNAQEYYVLPQFDPLRVPEMIRERLIDARSRGFAGLRIAAEMTWVLKGGLRDKALVEDCALVELESLIDEAMTPGPLTGACMYRRDRFAPAVLQRQIRIHAKVITDDRIYLSLSALFQNLAGTDLQGLAQCAREHLVPKRGFFFHQGDVAPTIYLLRSGAAKLFRTDSGGRSVTLRIIKPTEPFGDRAALLGTTRLASAQALEDSRALAWDAPTIRHALMSHPAFSMNALRLLEERLEDERGRLQDVATASVEQRLARVLLGFVQSNGHKTGRGVAIELPLSGRDLADLVLATPYTVSRILAEWKRLSIVGGRRDRVTVLDEQRLAAIARAA
jgi:CRP-like cAMP-binding protein